MADFEKLDKEFKRVQAFFTKYIRHKDEDKKHSEYAPSSMDRNLGCAGAVQMCEGLESKESIYSTRGTNTHTLMEFFLKEGDAGIKMLRHIAAKEFKKHIDYSSEMHQAAMLAVKYVRAKQADIIARKKAEPLLLVEEKVKLQDVLNADCGGTSDIGLLQFFGTLHVMDYKNGTGIVEPNENKQLMTYALGILYKYGWDFKDVELTIIQPNGVHKKGPIRSWRTSIERMEAFELELKAGIKKSKMKNPPLVMNSKWCYFCPARESKCPLHKSKRIEGAISRFDQTTRGKQIDE
jgi:hypothetical protein